MPDKLTKTETFITKAKAVHGERYDYSKVVYTNANTKVEIVCANHGSFTQQATKHVNCYQGCPKCASNGRRLSKENFIERAKAFHGDFYDYSKVEYTNSVTKVDIICPLHGTFQQLPPTHLKAGCNYCATERAAKKLTYTTGQFVEKAVEVHDNFYDYSETNYINSAGYVSIGCKLHGNFRQLAGAHLAGYGCPKCGREKGIRNKTHTSHQFIEKAKGLHEDFYNYSLVNYVNTFTKIDIVCEKNNHGLFSQAPGHHLQGNGCPKCGLQMSKAEDKVITHLTSLGLEVQQSDRSLINPLELDIVIPSKKIAIEYNGLRWHSEKFGKDKYYHKNKTDLCKAQGYRLIHIWEDDFNKDPQKELDFISYALGVSSQDKVYARKTTIRQIDNRVGRKFLDKYHIQGSGSGSVYYGTYFNDVLIAVTSFLIRKDLVELTRHSSDRQVLGGLGKVTKFASKELQKDIISFCDLTRFNGSSYLSCGYEVVKEIPPDYKYLVGSKREHKFIWRKKNIEKKLPDVYSDGLTEKQMMELADIPRIWDCGKLKLIYKYRSFNGN